MGVTEHGTSTMSRLSNHCQELYKDGSVCGESENLEILNEIKQIYEDRLRRIDQEAGDAGVELKLQTLQSWVKDLGDQNTILIQTVEQLEREASERVALLKEGLDRSARSALNFMNKLDEHAVGQKIVPADENEEFLHTKIRNYQSDITNLLELIRRAREENSWDVTGLVFTEITFDDVFDSLSPNFGQTNDISSDSKEKDLEIEDLKAEIDNLDIALKQKSQYENNQGSGLLQMQEEIITLREDFALKDSQIQGFVKRIRDLRADILDENEEGINGYKNTYHEIDKTVEQSFTDLDIHISKALRQRNTLAKEVQDLKEKLESKTAEMDRLSKTVNEMDQASKEMREALTAEVADKHDQILSLRREIQLLEERCHQADMQTHFKDNIIKEMRKDLKLARSKLAAASTSDEPDCQQHISCNQSEYHLPNILEQLYKRSSEPKEMQTTTNRSPSHLQGTDTAEKPHTSPSSYQQNSNPEKLTKFNNEKLYYTSCGRVSQNSSQYSSCYLEDVSDMAENLDAEETYYEVRRRNSPPSRENQGTSGNRPHSGGKIDSGSVPNISKKEMELKEIVEHLKDRLILRDNTIKEQEKTIKDLEVSLKRYEQDLGDLCAKTKKSEVELEDMKLKLISQVSGRTNEAMGYVQCPESEIEAWNYLIEQMKDLSVAIKVRENEISLKDSTLNDLQEKVRKSQTEIEILKGKCAIYLRDIQTAEQNQTDSERRIIELKDVLTKSYNGIEECLSCLAADPDVAKMLYNQDVKSFLERSEESEEAFKNLKAEMNYLAFFLKSREKQVKYLEGMIDSLNELLESMQKDMEDIENETCAYKKEKENLHNDHEKCVQKIEKLEKSLRFIQEERQKLPTKLESESEEEKLKQIVAEMQNNLMKQTDEVKESKMVNAKLRKEIDDANTRIKELERNVELTQSRELDEKAKLEALQSNLISREKVTKNQEEMIKILQDSVNMAQKEQEELQKKLIDAEAEKEKLLINLEESEKKAGNLQEALLLTKTQLEELQGKGELSAGNQEQLAENKHQSDKLHGNKYELSIRDRIIRFLHMDLSEIQSQYSNCYGEVVKQEKALDTLRDSNDDLRVEIVNLEQDIGILEFQLAEKHKIINFTKNRVEEMEKALNNRDTTIKDISNKMKSLENENRDLKSEKNELLKTIKEQSKIKKWECKVAQLKSSFDTVVKRNTTLEKEVNLLKQTLEDYRQQIDKSEAQTSASPSEVNNCMKTFKSLQERMSVLNNLLKEKSEDLAQVQAGYQVLQNELEMAKEQYNTLEASASEEGKALKQEIKDLEEKFQKYQHEYHRLIEEDQKHQKMLLEASNREIKLHNESMAREKELMGILEITQDKESKLSDTVTMLDRELQNVKTELAERDAQLQAVANQNQLSVQTIEKLQSELEAKTESVRSLQNNVNDLNASLVASMKKLEEKQVQLQELQAEITKLKCRLDFSEGYRGTTCDEVCTLQREASRLKTEIRRLMMIQEKATSEVREYLSIPESWWWDDFWQI